MKVTVLVRLKQEVLDPQGDAVKHALGTLGFENVKSVRIGKLIEIDVAEGADPKELRDKVEKMADAILANPVIEDYEIRM
jgi:phosphoribosylformylglycinamidine synthase